MKTVLGSVITQKVTFYQSNLVLMWHFCIFSKDDASVIFRDAAALNMTEAGYVWIVTEHALNANNTPYGVLGLQLVHAHSEKEHIRVSFWRKILF